MGRSRSRPRGPLSPCLAVGLLAALAASAPGCSREDRPVPPGPPPQVGPSRPADEDAKRELAASLRDRTRRQLHEESAPLAEVVSFRRLNGYSSGPLGQSLYAVEFEAEIKFREKCAWGGKVSRLTSSLIAGLQVKAPGDHVTFKDTLWLRPTENGWRAEVVD